MEMLNNFIGLTLQLSVPIVLGALCGTIAERGGIILLGVEGIMLVGAFAGVLGSYATGWALAGVVLSLVLGGLIGWFYALFCLKWKAHQSVVGVGINLFASGITALRQLLDVTLDAVYHYRLLNPLYLGCLIIKAGDADAVRDSCPWRPV